MNLLFLGQGPIAARCVAHLAAAARRGALRVSGLVAPPGAGDEWGPLLGVPAPARISNDARNEEQILEAVRRYAVDTLISVQHPWILSATTLACVGHRAFNLHNAKIPDYRGHHAISHAILNGDSTYTTTIHWIAPRVDRGDIAFEESFPIRHDDTARSLYDRSVEAALRTFGRLVDALVEGREVPRLPVQGTGRFYSKHLLADLKRIRSLADPVEVDRKARAFSFAPHEPAYFLLNGRRYYVSCDPS